MKMTVKVEQKNRDERQYKLCSSKFNTEIPVVLPAGFESEFTDGTKVKCQVSKHVSMTYNTAKMILERYRERAGPDKSTLTRAYFDYEKEQIEGTGLLNDAEESKRFCPVCGRQKEIAYFNPETRKEVVCQCNSNVVEGIVESRRSHYNKIGNRLSYQLGDDEIRRELSAPIEADVWIGAIDWLCHDDEDEDNFIVNLARKSLAAPAHEEDATVINVKGKWMLFSIPSPFKNGITPTAPTKRNYCYTIEPRNAVKPIAEEINTILERLVRAIDIAGSRRLRNSSNICRKIPQRRNVITSLPQENRMRRAYVKKEKMHEKKET